MSARPLRGPAEVPSFAGHEHDPDPDAARPTRRCSSSSAPQQRRLPAALVERCPRGHQETPSRSMTPTHRPSQACGHWAIAPDSPACRRTRARRQRLGLPECLRDPFTSSTRRRRGAAGRARPAPLLLASCGRGHMASRRTPAQRSSTSSATSSATRVRPSPPSGWPPRHAGSRHTRPARASARCRTGHAARPMRDRRRPGGRGPRAAASSRRPVPATSTRGTTNTAALHGAEQWRARRCRRERDATRRWAEACATMHRRPARDPRRDAPLGSCRPRARTRCGAVEVGAILLAAPLRPPAGGTQKPHPRGDTGHAFRRGKMSGSEARRTRRPDRRGLRARSLAGELVERRGGPRPRRGLSPAASSDALYSPSWAVSTTTRGLAHLVREPEGSPRIDRAEDLLLQWRQVPGYTQRHRHEIGRYLPYCQPTSVCAPPSARAAHAE